MSKTQWDEPRGSLYRFGSDLTATQMVSELRCSNGLGWSPDSRTFYFVESFAHAIYAFDFEAQSGVISGRRVFATLDPASGAFPDGLTVDAEGHVWNAQPVFGRLVRYDPDGRIDQIVETPVSRCTSCVFGGDDLGTMYVTSAQDSLTPEELIEEHSRGDYSLSGQGWRESPKRHSSADDTTVAINESTRPGGHPLRGGGSKQ
jgi:sugar lactone lactonase YvrE